MWPGNLMEDLKETIGHLLSAMSSFVHHFKAIGEFKLESQSGNAQFGSKLVIFFRCDLKIWRMILKNNKAHLLYYFKLCASFHSHLSIQNGIRVRKRQIWVKINDLFCPVWPWKMTDDIEKPKGHRFYATSSLVHYFIAICGFKMELQSGNTKFGSKSAIFCPVWPSNLIDDLENQLGTSSMLPQALCIISSPSVNSKWSYSPEMAKLDFDLCDPDLWSLTLTFCMGITSVIGNHSCKFHDDTMIGTQWKICDRRTDGQTDGKKCS